MPGGKRVRFLDPDETRRFLEATKGGAHEALYALAITTGMRPEEVYGLRWRDVDLDNRKLTINQVISKTRRKKGDTCARIEFGPPKTDKSRRTLDCPPFVAAQLDEHRSEVHELRASPATAGRITDSSFHYKSARRLRSATSCGGFSRSTKASACRACASTTCATRTRRC